MSPDFAVHLISQAFWTTVVLCAPLLLIGFAVGIVVNIIQIATSMQDSAFSTIPGPPPNGTSSTVIPTVGLLFAPVVIPRIDNICWDDEAGVKFNPGTLEK